MTRYTAIAACVLLSLSPALAAEERKAQGSTAKSVTLDFETGIKTTFYVDGTVAEDAFKPERLRWLAQRREGGARR